MTEKPEPPWEIRKTDAGEWRAVGPHNGTLESRWEDALAFALAAGHPEWSEPTA